MDLGSLIGPAAPGALLPGLSAPEGQGNADSGMRVLLVLEPPDGGVAHHVALLAEGLRSVGFAPEVAGPNNGMFREALTKSGVRYHVIPFTRRTDNPLHELRALVAIVRLARKRDFSLIHCHSSKAGVYGRLAAKLAGTPVIYTPHCFGFIGPVGRKRKFVATAVERLLAQLTSTIICVSKEEYREARAAKIPASRLAITVQGIPQPANFASDRQTFPDLATGGPVVGVINALRRQKRTDLFLDAIPRVWAQRPDVRFVVIGGGPSRNDLDAQAASLGLRNDPRFAFLDFEPPSERFLSGLDAFVLPSDWEGLSIGLIEALASGVPQVVSDIPSNLEVVTPDTGVSFPPGDVEGLAHAIVAVISDEGRSEKRRVHSRTRFDQNFTFDRMLAETAGIYVNTASKSSRFDRTDR